MNALSTFTLGLMLIIISSCAPSMDQERQQLFAPLLRIQAEFDAKLTEDLRHFKQQDEAFLAQVEKFKQKRSIFIASLSDKELLALSAFNKAQSDGDSALITLTSRKLVSLLSDSGKIAAFMAMCRENDELLAKAKALDKKQEELKDRVAKSKDFWATMQRLDREWEEWKQHRELVGALHGIDKSIRRTSKQWWIP